MLVDDGSTDGSEELCDIIASESTRVSVLHQKNAGVSAARNAGIEFVLNNIDNVQYLAFLDADDCWTENFFTRDSISSLPEATLIRFQSVNCNSQMKRCVKPADIAEGITAGGAAAAYSCWFSVFGASLYEKTLFCEQQIRFPEGLKHSEDISFLRKCTYNANSVAVCRRVLYLYRNNPMSCVHTRVKGFPYYEPMFEAYLAYDFDGKGFVSWYLVDAIEDHFMFGGTVSEARRWIAEHPMYVDIARERGGERAAVVLTALEKKPYRYALKLRLKGIAFTAARKVVHTPPLSYAIDLCRYRIKLTSLYSERQ